MSFFLLDESAEKVLKDILDRYQIHPKENKAVRDTIYAAKKEERDQIQRIVDFLCQKKYLSRKTKSSKVDNQTVKSVVYGITHEGELYFQNKSQAESISDEPQTQRRNEGNGKKYDVFLSHATADKLDYVDDLYSTLIKLGIKIFYDKAELSWGDNWKNVILDGTASSEFAIIIISDSFFDREWTERELSEFLQRQNDSGQKTILPLLHGISFEDMKSHYSELEFIQGIKTCDFSKEEIVIMFAKELLKRLKGA